MPITLRPFFSFFGGKWRVALKYPEPLYNTIIEPFAGSAGYSVRYYNRNIILIEKDPKIAGIWKYLIGASKQDIMNLPLLEVGQSIDTLNIIQEAKWLMGFCVNAGTHTPCKTLSAWAINFPEKTNTWGAKLRERMANQIEYIKHWKIIEGSYENAHNIKEATWFIDPPYIEAGKKYKYSSKQIDYTVLSEWCKDRQGQVMVCENAGASWLPFEPFKTIMGTPGKYRTGKSIEVLWEGGNI